MRVGGFTLIELMITISVAAILLAVAVPNFQGIVNESRITTQTNELITDLMVAKSESIRRGAKVAVCIRNSPGDDCNSSGTWNNGWIIFLDNNGNGSVGVGDTVLKVHEALPAGMTLVATTFATLTVVTYLPSGAINSAGIFTLCKPAFFGRNIAISATGRISTTKTSAICP